jgi:hypothetical protein
MSHPEEHLAAYVDGTLGARERAEVDAHLRSCPTCTEEVELAGRAYSLLGALPELRVPPSTIRSKAKGGRVIRPERFRRVQWAAGLAAAASVAAILALSLVGHSGSPTGNGPALSQRSPSSASEGSVVGRPGANYDAAGVRALAAQIARQTARHHEVNVLGSADTTSGAGASGTVSPTSKSAQQVFSSALAASPAGCVRSGAGLPASDRPAAVIEAKYLGTPAYIGAFIRRGTRSSVEVWVVGRRDCRILAEARQSIRSR